MPHVLFAIVAFVVVLAAPPAAAAPCAGFTDVEDTSPFCPNVSWLRNRNITFGCTATLYCPNDPVTRLQMAAFMNRLGDALFPLTCAAGQVMKWNGAAWACSDDNIGGGGGGGTVTSVLAGTGLTASPNPIVGAGSINLAASYQLPQSCANGQVAKSNGAGGWTCGTDVAGTGTVTSLTAGTGITLTPDPITTTGTIAVNTVAIQQRVTGSCAVGNYIRAIAADGTVTCQADSGGPANAYVQGGNAFGAAGILGTTDNQALDLHVNGSRAMRYEPNAISPNVIGGSPANSVTAGVRGATIAGGGVPTGGDSDFGLVAPNRVTDAYGTVGGGYDNRAGNDAGGTLDRPLATVGGGVSNAASGYASMVGGGSVNTASGTTSTVGGGSRNLASGSSSTVGGGQTNTASGDQSAVGGGFQNTASGVASTVAGGSGNIASGDYSFAAGNRARADHAGCFSFSNWSSGFTGTCLGVPHVARFTLDHGLSVEYFSRRPADGGGTRWVYVGDIVAGSTISTWTGASLTDAGVWTNVSDRAAKDGFTSIDAQAVLEGVVNLPITRWHYRQEGPGVAHIGPTAQDFKAVFGLGQGDTGIGTVDADGVALAAIQGLNAKLVKRDSRIDVLERELERLRSVVDALLGRFDATLVKEVSVP